MKTLASVSLMLLVLAGCGGGGGGGGGDDNDGGFPVSTVAPEATVSASLASSDVKAPDGTYTDLYKVTIPTGGTLTVKMTSTEIDPYLLLLEDECLDVENIDDWEPYLITDDDDSGGGDNAQITMQLVQGTYVIVANSFDVETGSYSLITSFGAGSARMDVISTIGKKQKIFFDQLRTEVQLVGPNEKAEQD